MLSLALLSGYIAICSLDSFHLRPGATQDATGLPQRVLSAFDVLTIELWRDVEKTYSSPFALYSYSKEYFENAQGEMVRDFPRLVHGGTHLQDTSGRAQEIWSAGSTGVVWGAIIFVLVLALSLFSRNDHITQGLRKIWLGKTDIALRSLAIGFAVLAFCVAFIAELGGLYHIFGTDKVGQDVLYQTLKSVRTGILIGTLTTLIMLPFAIVLGILAGYFGGLLDDLIQYLYTTLSSIPGVLLIAASILLLQVYLGTREESIDALARADLRLLFLCAILGITSWTSLCRILRAETLKIRELEFIRAARASGASGARILSVHILPNLFHIILIIVILDFSGLVLAEAVLSYVGVGVDPTMNSWGNMINQARLELGREPVVWWSLSAAFVFMFVLVLAANILADAVRAAFDPRTREVL
jgi:peptide/nickel transport system permease protein